MFAGNVPTLACYKQGFNYEEFFNLEILKMVYRVGCAIFPCRPLPYLLCLRHR